MDATVSLQTVDYIVIALILSVSLGIGIWFAVKDFKNVNRVEYLLGGRRMSMLPVAFSVFATFSSGIAYIGLTADVYFYGAMSCMLLVGMSLSYISAALTLVPLMYPLKLTSLYEYVQLRFDSTVLRLFVVVVGMFQTLCYMSVALLTPALVIEAGFGLPLWMSIGVVGSIGTVYTAIGGIKSVVWTDAFQCLVMMGGVFTIIIKSNMIVGGGDSAWQIAHDGGRTAVNNFSLDPRERNTWWGSIFGGFVFWLATICNQSSLQRISSMKSVKDARNAFLLTSVIFALHMGLLVGVGLVMYAYFVKLRCDPLQAGHINNRNQLTIYFVVHAMADLPGIGGIYMATMFSGALSTVSSGINALAANTIEDLLKKPLQNVQESTVTFITKVIVFLYGILILCLAYGASSIKGPLVQMTMVALGTWCGPVFGVFLLGSLVPWGNKYGALCGGIIALIFNMWIAIGHVMYGRKPQMLALPETDMCQSNSPSADLKYENASVSYFKTETVSTFVINQSSIMNNSYTEQSSTNKFDFFLYDISYDWYGLIGTFVSLFLGMAISYFTRRHCKLVNDPRLLFHFVRRFWLPKSAHRSQNREEDGGMLQLPGAEMNGYIISDYTLNKCNKC